MRMRILVAPIALFLALAGKVALAQTQQGQSDTSSSRPAAAKQSAAATRAQASAAASSSATAKAEPKASVVLTNDNLGDASARTPAAASAANPQSDSKPAQSQNPQAQTQQTAPQGAAPAATPKPKLQLPPHQVLTNEDLPKVIDKEGVNVVGNDADLSTMYDCDVNCYDQARQAANVYPGRDLTWMRELHDGIEKLKNDEKWRAFLVNLVDLRSRYCKLAAEENSELYRVDNQQDVTDEQINIRADYNRKLDELNQESTAAYGRVGSLQMGYSPLIRGFMQVQEMRVARINCVSPYQNRYYGDPGDPNER
jgi:hypothetical protein